MSIGRCEQTRFCARCALAPALKTIEVCAINVLFLFLLNRAPRIGGPIWLVLAMSSVIPLLYHTKVTGTNHHKTHPRAQQITLIWQPESTKPKPSHQSFSSNPLPMVQEVLAMAKANLERTAWFGILEDVERAMEETSRITNWHILAP